MKHLKENVKLFDILLYNIKLGIFKAWSKININLSEKKDFSQDFQRLITGSKGPSFKLLDAFTHVLSNKSSQLTILQQALQETIKVPKLTEQMIPVTKNKINTRTTQCNVKATIHNDSPMTTQLN